MNSKKILIVIYSMTTGGAERQIVTDSKILTSAGYRVTIAYYKEGPLLHQIDRHVETLKIKFKNEIFANIQLLTYLTRYNFDAILAHMFWAQKISALPAFLTKQKLFFFDHGLGLWRKKYHLLISRFITTFAKYVVTASYARKQLKIKREKINEKKILVIHNCYNFTESQQISKNHVPFEKDKFVIGFAGRFNRVKQLQVLVELAKQIQKVTQQFLFVLMGDGTERQGIEKLVKDNGLNNHFIFTGYINKPMTIMSHFNVFILPSKREDFSVALLEAGSLGLPSVAFDVGGNKEIILDGETGYIIPPYDVRLFAEKLIFLIQNKQKVEEIGIKASQRIKQVFSEENRLKAVINLINS